MMNASKTLNQLLVEMDGFESNEGVILIAAKTAPTCLIPFLLRPGRFDRQVMVPTPDSRGRRRILEVHTKRTPFSPTWIWKCLHAVHRDFLVRTLKTW